MSADVGTPDPIRHFEEVYARALRTDLPEPTAVALATATRDGRPSVRMVLLKGFDARGFVFYTNLQSRKGRELAENPYAALCFHWQPLEEQVRVEGRVEAVTDEEADAYFASRPWGSRIGAWASRQSEPLPARAVLEERIREFETRYPEGSDVPRPPHWSGFRLVPERIEFWKAQSSRLHRREVYLADPESPAGWRVETLYP